MGDLADLYLCRDLYSQLKDGEHPAFHSTLCVDEAVQFYKSIFCLEIHAWTPAL